MVQPKSLKEKPIKVGMMEEMHNVISKIRQYRTAKGRERAAVPR